MKSRKQYSRIILIISLLVQIVLLAMHFFLFLFGMAWSGFPIHNPTNLGVILVYYIYVISFISIVYQFLLLVRVKYLLGVREIYCSMFLGILALPHSILLIVYGLMRLKELMKEQRLISKTLLSTLSVFALIIIIGRFSLLSHPSPLLTNSFLYNYSYELMSDDASHIDYYISTNVYYINSDVDYIISDIEMDMEFDYLDYDQVHMRIFLDDTLVCDTFTSPNDALPNRPFRAGCTVTTNSKPNTVDYEVGVGYIEIDFYSGDTYIRTEKIEVDHVINHGRIVHDW